MSFFTLHDFAETVQLFKSQILKVEAAWGWKPMGFHSWEGGFICLLRNGLYLYACGQCGVDGWGSDDVCDYMFFDHFPTPVELQTDDYDAPEWEDWDRSPSDCNRYVRGEIDSRH